MFISQKFLTTIIGGMNENIKNIHERIRATNAAFERLTERAGSALGMLSTLQSDQDKLRNRVESLEKALKLTYFKHGPGMNEHVKTKKEKKVKKVAKKTKKGKK